MASVERVDIRGKARTVKAGDIVPVGCRSDRVLAFSEADVRIRPAA